MSNGTPFQIRQLPQILKRRQLLGIYLITFLVASAYYTGYSYIEPFLKQVALSGNIRYNKDDLQQG